MQTVICTLFEGDYHYGVAALVNSLYKHGYRGDVYVGYRGSLPPWASSSVKTECSEWLNSTTYQPSVDLSIHFLPVITERHLTNYKAEFILQLWKGIAKHAGSVVYFDPDIVVKCDWSFYEKWMSYGVALVHEVVNNDMPPTHPVRKMWENVVTENKKVVTRNLTSYINAGFCGITKSNIHFVNTWADIINIAITNYSADPKKFSSFNRMHPFWSIDQDAINIVAMCSEEPISLMGPEGMDFIYGGWTMSHATGSPKPWRKHYLGSALKGLPPSLAEKEYHQYIQGLIKTHSISYIKIKKASLLVSALIGRFYRRY